MLCGWAHGAAAASPRRKELAVWGTQSFPGLKVAFDKFEAEYPQWRIIASSGAGTGEMDPQKLMCGIAGGSPPDMLRQDRFSIGEWASRDAFVALDEFIARSNEQEALATAARRAIEKGDGATARAKLKELIDALAEIAPCRQLTLARKLAADLAGPDAISRRLTERLAEARLLTQLCQGVHRETFYRACWEEACYGSGEARRVYAVPNATDVRALFYNQDLLDRARDELKAAGIADVVDKASGKVRPPRTWPELKIYATVLTETDKGRLTTIALTETDKGRLTRVGFAPNYGNSWLYIYGWLNGGKFMSDDGRTCTLDDLKIVEALRYMVDIYDAIGGIKKVDSFQSTFQADQFDPFLMGKVAMKIDGDFFQNTISQHAPSLRFGVAPAPAPLGRKSITWSGGHSWAIPAGTANPRMAFELIRFLNSDRIWELRTRVRSRYAASRGRAFVPQMAPLPHINHLIYDKFIEGNPDLAPRIKKHLLFFAELMKTSKFRPVTPVGQKLWDEHIRAYELAAHHELTPKRALEESCKRVQRELDLLESKKGGRAINWAYPIGAAGMLAAIGMAVIYFRCGRRKLLTRMMLPESRAGLAFVSPWVVGFIVLTAGPIVVSIVYSFCRYDVLHGAQFVGLDNYHELLTDDPLFWKSLANTGFMILGVPLGMAVGLGVAMLLNMKVRGMQVYRTIFYLPAIVPAVASAVLWIWVLNPQMGLINSMLRTFGVSDPPNWLKSPEWLFGSKSAIIIMGLWGAGAGMIIWLAGLKGIPQSLYESAQIDGAGALQRFAHITLPMLTPYIFFNLIMGVIGTLQIFSQAYIMTQGGPVDSTMFYAYYLFNNGFRYFRMGYASALAWILFVIILVLTLIQLKLAPKWVHYESN